MPISFYKEIMISSNEGYHKTFETVFPLKKDRELFKAMLKDGSEDYVQRRIAIKNPFIHNRVIEIHINKIGGTYFVCLDKPEKEKVSCYFFELGDPKMLRILNEIQNWVKVLFSSQAIKYSYQLRPYSDQLNKHFAEYLKKEDDFYDWVNEVLIKVQVFNDKLIKLLNEGCDAHDLITHANFEGNNISFAAQDSMYGFGEFGDKVLAKMRIDNQELHMTLSTELEVPIIQLFATNTNILNISEGMAGIEYSN